MQAAFAELGQRWGGELNVLINTVGPGAAGSFEDLTDDQWLQSVEEGVMGMVRCVRAALPLLRRAEWARVVNFAAQSTQRQSARLSAYTAAKSMVTSVSKNLSLFLAPDEILVNVVSPGSIASEALTGWAESVGVDGSHAGCPERKRRRGEPEAEAARSSTFAAASDAHDRNGDGNERSDRNRPRSDDAPARGQWWVPGGRVVKGETMRETARRKAREEVGLDCHVGPIIHTAATIFPDGPRGITVHSINACFLLYPTHDSNRLCVKLDTHHAEWRWEEKVTAGLHPYVAHCLRGAGLEG